MCTAMEEIKKEYISQGISQGITQGISQGIDLGQFRTLGNLTEKKYITIEQAAEEAGMSTKEFISKIKIM